MTGRDIADDIRRQWQAEAEDHPCLDHDIERAAYRPARAKRPALVALWAVLTLAIAGAVHLAVPLWGI